jgi:REP element-mobilizing transposase RayT
MPKRIDVKGTHRCPPKNNPGHRALRKGRISLPRHAYLATTTTANRVGVFVDFKAACTACRCFESEMTLGDAGMLAWVLMPDHAHWLIQLGDREPLDRVVARLKSVSARSVNRVLGRKGPLWSRAYHDHALRSDEDVKAIARYIIGNPVRAGLVEQVGDYPFWNAVWI